MTGTNKVRGHFLIFFLEVILIGTVLIIGAIMTKEYFDEERALQDKALIAVKGITSTVESTYDWKALLANTSSSNPAYIVAQRQMQNMAQISGADCVYVMTRKDGYTFRYVLDSSDFNVISTDPLDDVTKWGRPGIVDAWYDGLVCVNRIHNNPEYGVLLSAFAPIYKDGQIVAVVGVDYGVDNIIAELTDTVRFILPIFVIIVVFGGLIFDLKFGSKCCSRGIRCKPEEACEDKVPFFKDYFTEIKIWLLKSRK